MKINKEVFDETRSWQFGFIRNTAADGKNRERAKMRTAYQRSIESGDMERADNIESNNLGTEKYNRRKEKERAKTQAFINTEINKMLAAEKPKRIVITKLVTINKTKFFSKQTNKK